jgi:formylglycine-generating enzyme required for sulfatase activity
MRAIPVAVTALLVPVFAACGWEDERVSCGEVTSCPADMVKVSANCGSFCIDGTEVTYGQYSVFLAQAPPVTGQREGCEWNTSFEPGDAGCANGPAPAGDPILPVTCVDWCDAAAFCKSAGKRLCTGLDHRDRPARWEAACNAVFGHVETSPPGCNFMTGALRPVGTSQGCHGKSSPLDSLFDLIGNVAEWTEDCDSDFGSQYCLALGASALDGGPACSEGTGYEPTYRDAFLGFRCCAP